MNMPSPDNDCRAEEVSRRFEACRQVPATIRNASASDAFSLFIGIRIQSTDSGVRAGVRGPRFGPCRQIPSHRSKIVFLVQSVSLPRVLSNKLNSRTNTPLFTMFLTMSPDAARALIDY